MFILWNIKKSFKRFWFIIGIFFLSFGFTSNWVRFNKLCKNYKLYVNICCKNLITKWTNALHNIIQGVLILRYVLFKRKIKEVEFRLWNLGIKYFLSQYNNGFEDIKIHTFDKVLRIQCSAPSLFRQGVEEDKMQPAAWPWRSNWSFPIPLVKMSKFLSSTPCLCRIWGVLKVGDNGWLDG